MIRIKDPIQLLLQAIKRSELLKNLPEDQMVAIAAQYKNATPEQIVKVIAEIRKKDEKMERQTHEAEQELVRTDENLKNALTEYKQFNKRVMQNNENQSQQEAEKEADRLISKIITP